MARILTALIDKNKNNMKVKNITLILAILFCSASMNSIYSDTGTPTKNQVVKEKIIDSDYIGCRTVTIGINAIFIYIETTVTICCVSGGPAGVTCWELDNESARETNKKVIFDLTETLSKNSKIDKSKLNYIEVTKSTVADFDGLKVKIKKGKYKVGKNSIVNLDYTIVK